MSCSNVITSILYNDSTNTKDFYERVRTWLKFEFNFVRGQIIAKISNTQECCEEYGVFAMCNEVNMIDSLQSYVGKELVNVDVFTRDFDRDGILYKYKKVLNEQDKTISLIKTELGSELIIRLSFMNDEHPLDIMMYNNHNGYYPHDIYFQLNLEMNGYTLNFQESTEI
jgi:hypothetical protein